ncbi:MAG: putative transcriptional regulator YheO, partial [Candidatus Marinamargulisbacteria bacterium]
LLIHNGQVSGREVGMTFSEYDYLSTFDEAPMQPIKSHWTAPNGKRLKNISVVFRDKSKKAVYALGMNFDTNSFKNLSEALLQFSDFDKGIESRKMTSTATASRTDEIRNEILKVMWHNSIDPHRLSRKDKKMIVEKLYLAGDFNRKGIVNILSDELSITKMTIYNYISEIKERLGD